jgi:hypothetical protein
MSTETSQSYRTLPATAFPTLTRAQIYECLAYDEDHRGEIDLLVARQMAHEQP